MKAWTQMILAAGIVATLSAILGGLLAAGCHHQRETMVAMVLEQR